MIQGNRKPFYSELIGSKHGSKHRKERATRSRAGRARVKPTDAEKEQMQKEAEAQAGQPPSAQDAFLIAEAEKSRNLAQKAQAETLQTLEEVKQTKAETEKTLAQAQEIIKKMGLLDMDTLLRLVEMNRSAPAATVDAIPAIEVPPVAPPEQTQLAQ